ncbi:MAG: PAS domain S-box protein, partial [Chloroflexota bacterium]
MLERVLGSMAAPALIFRSGDYAVVYANYRAEETLGFEPGTLPGTDLRSLVDYESGIRPLQERRHQAGQPRGEYEVVAHCPDGRMRRAWGSFEEITYQGERSFLNVFTNVTEMREAEETSRRETRERETLAEIGRIVTSSPDISQVFARFSEAVKQLIPCEGTRIFTVRPGTSEITNGHVYGLASSYDGSHRHDAPAGTLRQLLLRTREGIVIPDLEVPGRLADLSTLEHLRDA